MKVFRQKSVKRGEPKCGVKRKGTKKGVTLPFSQP